MKQKIDAVIICEGKHDKIKLLSIFDTTIITTDGFAIFKDKEKLNMIKELSLNKKVIIITDGDSAGFKIRNYIKNYVQNDNIIDILIPDIYGKEKRKTRYSKEGKLGVEGLEKDILIKLINNVIDITNNSYKGTKITKIDLLDYGLVGGSNSHIKRKKLLNELNLPERTSTNTLINVVNILYSKEQFLNILDKLLL